MTAGTGGMCVIVPVKGLGDAKSRLAEVLTPPQRAALVLAMLEDVLIAVRAAHAGLLLLVTPDEEYAPAASRAGAELIEDRGGGYNAAVTQALAAAAAREAGVALVLPADQPRAQPAELRAAIEALGEASVAVAPSRDGGTGLLGLRPPDVIAPAFGIGSAARHRALGEAAGLPVAWLELPSLRDDVDEAGDLLRGVTPLGEATAAFVAGHASLLEQVSRDD
ncbi:MAG: 2-phospho-L-lactate guanylyltransferase [Chloroflexi bacterium]|nr:2-phospho-L-lactate guanylyltransferase [Chloroflexota bacterium]